MRRKTWKIIGGLICATGVAGILLAVVSPQWLPAGVRNLPSLYESAEGTTGTALEVGFVTVRLKAIARNDRDGKVYVTDGKNQPASWDSAKLNIASAWLDRAAVQLETEGGELEILEARIFDHATRELMALKYDDTAVFPRGTEVIEFSRVGDLLPKTIDVWVRAWIQRAGQPSYRLDAKPGATTAIGEGKLIMGKIASGWAMWSSNVGFVDKTGLLDPEPQVLPNVPGISVEFRWQGEMPEGRYRIVAIDRDGETRYYDNGAIDFGYMKRLLLHFPIAPDELGHFEIEPVGERVAFFFEAVELPAASEIFQPPPTLKHEIGGKKVAKTIADFGTFRILAVSFGTQMCETGAREQNGNLFITLRPCEDENERRGCSVLVQSRGVNLNAWDLELLGDNGKKLEWGNRSTFRAGGLVICHAIDLSLDKVDSIMLSPRKE